MDFSRWFRGYGAQRELEFKYEKISKEMSELKRSVDTQGATIAHLKMENARLIGAHVKKLDDKDKEMASWIEEVNRLKKLIELNRHTNPESTGIPPIKPADQIKVSDEMYEVFKKREENKLSEKKIRERKGSGNARSS